MRTVIMGVIVVGVCSAELAIIDKGITFTAESIHQDLGRQVTFP